MKGRYPSITGTDDPLQAEPTRRAKTAQGLMGVASSVPRPAGLLCILGRENVPILHPPTNPGTTMETPARFLQRSAELVRRQARTLLVNPPKRMPEPSLLPADWHVWTWDYAVWRGLCRCSWMKLYMSFSPPVPLIEQLWTAVSSDAQGAGACEYAPGADWTVVTRALPAVSGGQKKGGNHPCGKSLCSPTCQGAEKLDSARTGQFMADARQR